MEKLKEISKKIFCLNPLLTMIIALPSFALVAYVLITGMTNTVIGYISYGLSAYALIIFITAIYPVIVGTKKKVTGSRMWNRYQTDLEFRTKVSLYPGLAMNTLYVAVNLVSGLLYKSFWFVALSIYYVLLMLMRVFLVGHIRNNAVGEDMVTEKRKYKLCAVLLMVMDLALAIVVFFMVYWNRGYEYPGLLIYVMAAYTFSAMAAAIVNLVKFRKYNSPVVTAGRVLNLTAATVSILSLETAMLSEFGKEESPEFHRIMIGLTGAGVCVFVMVMAIYMLKKISKLDDNN